MAQQAIVDFDSSDGLTPQQVSKLNTNFRLIKLALDKINQANDESKSNAKVGMIGSSSALRDADTAAQAAAAAQSSANAASVAAEDAQESANEANNAAHSALYSLSDVEKVVGTLNWISEHGRYDAATETSPVQGRIYYTRSGAGTQQDPYVYTIVGNIDPDCDPSQLGYYYLVIDESVQNYIASHLVQTQYGLDLLIDDLTLKMHLGTLNGSRMMGTYIVDNDGGVAALFGTEMMNVGENIFNVGRIVEADGYIGSTINYTGDGSKYMFQVPTEPEYIKNFDENNLSLAFSIKVNDIEKINDAYWSIGDLGIHGGYLYFADIEGDFIPLPPEAGSEIVIKYRHNDVPISLEFGRNAKANGVQAAAFSNGSASGENAFAEGDSIASGAYSHAEGYNSVASGSGSHAEGGFYYFNDPFIYFRPGGTASGFASHAQNIGTIAMGEAQTAMGKYNIQDNNDKYALIIGNGTNSNSRSNAFTIEWNGIVRGTLFVGNGVTWSQLLGSSFTWDDLKGQQS